MRLRCAGVASSMSSNGIDRAVTSQRALALDTPAGARNFLNFLAVKRQDIAPVVSEAAADSDAKAALLQSLGSQYAATKPRDGVQLLGSGEFAESPRFPLPADHKPWEYNLDLTSGIEVHQPPLPGLVNAGTVTSIDDVWNELHRCFNCNFPIGGAPREFPKVGQHLPLEMRIAGQQVANLPVEVTQIQRTGDEINIEFATLPGHVDGPGSTIHFRFYQQGGELHLGIRGYITEGPGSQSGPLGLHCESAIPRWRRQPGSHTSITSHSMWPRPRACQHTRSPDEEALTGGGIGSTPQRDMHFRAEPGHAHPGAADHRLGAPRGGDEANQLRHRGLAG